MQAWGQGKEDFAKMRVKGMCWKFGQKKFSSLWEQAYFDSELYCFKSMMDWCCSDTEHQSMGARW